MISFSARSPAIYRSMTERVARVIPGARLFSYSTEPDTMSHRQMLNFCWMGSACSPVIGKTR